VTAALEHLARLCAFDTTNPPRDPTRVDALLGYVAAAVEGCGFGVERRDLGDGCMWLLARRSAPTTLVNVHIDTVPVAEGWSGDPFRLVVDGDRATALGACDTKGALAAWLAAAESTAGAGELLLTSDEEAGTSLCVRTFAAEHELSGRAVVVAEPTSCRAVLAHRGIGTMSGTFSGVGGHASQARALDDSAVHEAIRWAAPALELAAANDLRFNLGRVEGGTKANMIAASASLRFGIRPRADVEGNLARLCALARDPARVRWERGYLAPALVESDAAQALARHLGAEVSAPVDFFTEAALFAEAGASAIVLGPGDIAHAHAPAEHVPLSQLALAERIYARLLSA
jgi:acetylornithine deacetylase